MTGWASYSAQKFSRFSVTQSMNPVKFWQLHIGKFRFWGRVHFLKYFDPTSSRHASNIWKGWSDRKNSSGFLTRFLISVPQNPLEEHSWRKKDFVNIHENKKLPWRSFKQVSWFQDMIFSIFLSWYWKKDSL